MGAIWNRSKRVFRCNSNENVAVMRGFSVPGRVLLSVEFDNLLACLGTRAKKRAQDKFVAKHLTPSCAHCDVSFTTKNSPVLCTRSGQYSKLKMQFSSFWGSFFPIGGLFSQTHSLVKPCDIGTLACSRGRQG